MLTTEFHQTSSKPIFHIQITFEHRKIVERTRDSLLFSMVRPESEFHLFHPIIDVKWKCKVANTIGFNGVLSLHDATVFSYYRFLRYVKAIAFNKNKWGWIDILCFEFHLKWARIYYILYCKTWLGFSTKFKTPHVLTLFHIVKLSEERALKALLSITLKYNYAQ